MTAMIETIVTVFVVIGVFFAVVSAIGILRLKDVYSRAHASGKSATLGVIFIMLAVFIHFLTQGEMNAKILLAILFLFLTAPVASLMVTRSAYRNGVKLDKNTITDDLKEMYDTDQNQSN
ncbi:Na(+)/H(+) antiporter subunit G [Oceanobacillus oncorhynchi]|uniref:Na(+)/H(+) antiporter subunit G n=2 Tax=Oceanobacillus oncorhynchi TaxID=545501 RepID=A0A0A1MMB0_9BACI|nr:monovalent cation/H(+) antiporter subunit G [Oceanobacillus oncorhynchi]UUI38535.1 monovalent cation/H(+) antiporter subunit G [Oceanobacillus oncorhynchi]CEI84223.1 Na(+)/H(+) antiporter subunit G [Oceanobacillus oncorhynchi]